VGKRKRRRASGLVVSGSVAPLSVRTLSEQRRADILESARVPALIAQLSMRRSGSVVDGVELVDGPTELYGSTEAPTENGIYVVQPVEDE